MFEIIIELGDKLSDLVREQSEWSQSTFGTDATRGPIGPLKHLAKEAVEAQAAWVAHGHKSDAVRMELADCLLLILDASRRAGIKPMQLIEAGLEKMKINKSRTWPTPTSDAPVEHVRPAGEPRVTEPPPPGEPLPLATHDWTIRGCSRCGTDRFSDRAYVACAGSPPTNAALVDTILALPAE